MLVAATWLGWLFTTHRFASAPSDPHVDLTKVAGPIGFENGTTSNHDGTWNLRFKDSCGITREVDLEGGALEGATGDVVVRFGSIERRLPRSGEEEKALADLLERWAEADPEARRINQQGEIHWEVEGKEVGVSVLRELRKRNRSP